MEPTQQIVIGIIVVLATTYFVWLGKTVSDVKQQVAKNSVTIFGETGENGLNSAVKAQKKQATYFSAITQHLLGRMWRVEEELKLEHPPAPPAPAPAE